MFLFLYISEKLLNKFNSCLNSVRTLHLWQKFNNCFNIYKMFQKIKKKF